MPPLASEPRDAKMPARLLPTLKRFLPYLWPKDATELRVRVVVAFALVLASKAISIAMPFALKAVVDRMTVGAGAALGLIFALVLAYAGARFAAVLSDNLRNLTFEKVGQTATQNLATHVFKRLHMLSLRFHLSRRTGEVTKIIERGTKSIDTMLYFLLFNLSPTAIELTVVLIIFGIKFGAGLVIATIAMVAIYIFFTQRVTDWRNHLRARMNRLDGQALARAVDSLLNYETVKYFGAEEREAARYTGAAKEYAAAAVKSENSLAMLNVGQSLITNLMMAGAMVYSVWGWSRGLYTVGDLVLINGLLMQLFRPLDLLGMVYRTIRQGVIDMQAMFDLIDTRPEITDAPGALALTIESPRIRFVDVHFGYDADRKILNGLSFDVPAGSTLAIVGPSGAGKSTIARLLYRFYDPQSGCIEIDGQDIRTVTQASLRAAIGIVPQDTVLFNDTIGYNIAYGKDGTSEADMIRGAKGAAISNFIEGLPQHYDTQVGERGLKLSGGEKQRVAIARTLVKNPPVLILDEATSALDSRTEAEILATLRGVAKGRTTITIAHRLSTITHADEILVLNAGQVAERGTHRQLLAKRGLYAEMWERQAQEAVHA